MKLSRVLALLVLVALFLGGALYLTRDVNSLAREAELGALAPGQEQEDAVGAARAADLAAVDEQVEFNERREEASPERVKKAKAKAAEKTVAAPTGPWLTGVVVGDDGLPVSGAEVTVRAQGLAEGLIAVAADALSEETTTDRDGEFRVPRGLVFQGDANIELRARGYLGTSEVRAIEAVKGNVRFETIVMQRGVVLGGQVLAADGTPVEGARVERTEEGAFRAPGGIIGVAMAQRDGGAGRATTDSEGRFVLENEEAGPYLLIVEHDEHPEGRFEGETPTPGGEDLALSLRLEPAARISGRILNFPSGKKGVSIQCSRRSRDEEDATSPVSAFFESAFGGGDSAVVKKDGSFVLEGLPVNASFRLEANLKNGFFGNVPCSDALVVDSGATEVELTWDSGAQVSFQPVAAETGKPLRTGLVRYRWTDSVKSGMPDPQKKHEFESKDVVVSELRPPGTSGTLEMAIVVEGYLEHRIDETLVEAGGSVELGEVHLRRAPLVRVRVVEAATGAPLRRARVRLSPESEEQMPMFSIGGEGSHGRTDKQGYCELPACSTETATLRATKSGFAPIELEGVFMPREAPSEETIRMFKGGRLELHVLDEVDVPVANAQVQHRLPDESIESHAADSHGVLSMKNLTPGEHAFHATRSRGGRRGMVRFNVERDDDAQWVTVVVGSGGDHEAVLRVPALATLHGVVTSRGELIGGAKVRFLTGEEGGADEEFRAAMRERGPGFGGKDTSSTVTNSQGRYQLAGVTTGKHRLSVQRGDGSPSFTVPVEIHRGDNDVDVSLPSSNVRGRIVDSRGDGIEGARVTVVRSELNDGEREAREQMRRAMSFFGGSGSDGVETEYDGSYTILGLSPNVKYVVEASSSGFVVGQSEPFEVNEDQDVNGVDVTLRDSGSIRATLEGSTRPFQVIHARKQLKDGPSEGSEMAVVQDGVATLRDLSPGTWSVSLSEDSDAEGQLVEVRAGVESAVHLMQ